MGNKKINRRKRGLGPLLDGDVDSASVVTPTTVYVTKKDGSVVEKQVWESLDTPTPNASTSEKPPPTPTFVYETMENHSPPPERSQTHRVRI